MTKSKAIENFIKAKKQPSRLKQQTNNKVFIIRLKLALKKASNTEVQEVYNIARLELERRNQKCKQ